MKNFNKLLFSFLFLSSSFFLQAQTPGGIATGNTMWLRADAGVTVTAGAVTQWNDLSAANVTGNFTLQNIPGTPTVQTGPGFTPSGANFNPFLNFNGTTSSLTTANSFSGSLLVSNSNSTVFQVIYLRGGVVWLKWETDQQGTGARLGFENASGRIRYDFPRADPPPAGQNVGVTDVLNRYVLSTAYADASTSVNRLNGITDHTITAPTPGNFTPVSKLCLGNDYLLNLPAQLFIGEEIIYSRTLTAAEINKVETYLAVKYGVTLDQTGSGNNYTATDGTVIWNSSANTGFGSNITGIGRDDAENLLQKQSRTINTNPIVTIYNNNTYAAGVFPTTNVANTNGIAGDKQFLLIGDDGGATTINSCIFNGKGQRMTRVWKVSNTGFSTPVTYSIDQATVPAYVKNIIVSANPTFPPGSTTIYPLTAANSKLYKDLVLNNNDYFTYATDTIITAPVVTPPTCANPNSASIITNITGTNAPLTYLWQPDGQTTPDITNVPANTYILGVTQGSCTANFTFVINPTPAPAAPVANDVAVCNGSTATLTVQSPNAAYTYNWYTVPTAGTAVGTGTSFTTPPITAPVTYYVDATSGPCTGVRTAVNVTITPVTGAVVNNESICSGTAATFTVQNPVAGQTYNWYSVPTAGTALATGTTFTTPVLTTNATYYVETVNAGCTIPRTAVTVTTTGIPAPSVNNAAICTGSSAALSIQSPNASYTYNWYAASTGGTTLFTGTTFNTPALTTTTTYYAEAIGGTCISPRSPATVTVTTIAAPVVPAAAVCINNTAILNVQSPNAALTYNWYSASTGGTTLFTGTTFTTPLITAPTTYYAEATDGSCNSIRTPVAVSLLPTLTTPSVTVSSATISSVTFGWNAIPGAIGYQVSVSGGMPVLVGTSITHYTVTGLQPSESTSISVIALSGPTGCGDSSPGFAQGAAYSDGFFVPTAFSPNGDTKNDILIPHIPGDALLAYFTVYNRWGQPIFTTAATGTGWDGSWQGKQQPNGVYVWMCSYIRGTAVVQTKGSVMLVR